MAKPSMPPATLKPRLVALLSVLVGGGALFVAACGGSPSSDASVAHLQTTTTAHAAGGTNTTTQSGDSSGAGGGSGPGAPSGQSQFSLAGGNQSQMLAFSHCMQTHGVPNFPEPNSQGVASASGINPGSSSFQAANKDCSHLLPNGGQPTPAQQAHAMAQALKFSQCMRAHGIADFPDPQSGPGGGIRIALRAGKGSDLNPQSPQFQAAQQACQGIMGGPLGGGKFSSGGAAKQSGAK
jgi:hypothetical protein